MLPSLPRRCPVCGRVMTEEEAKWTCEFCGRVDDKSN